MRKFLLNPIDVVANEYGLELVTPISYEEVKKFVEEVRGIFRGAFVLPPRLDQISPTVFHLGGNRYLLIYTGNSLASPYFIAGHLLLLARTGYSVYLSAELEKRDVGRVKEYVNAIVQGQVTVSLINDALADALAITNFPEYISHLKEESRFFASVIEMGVSELDKIRAEYILASRAPFVKVPDTVRSKPLEEAVLAFVKNPSWDNASMFTRKSIELFLEDALSLIGLRVREFTRFRLANNDTVELLKTVLK